jgi:hypothetical protein
MACGPNLKVLREMKARGVIRDCDLFVVTGLRKTQRDELRKRGELFNLYPVYEGGRGKFAYDDEVRCWQDWRDAWLAGRDQNDLARLVQASLRARRRKDQAHNLKQL